jgi:purine-nucleoside phosphorylase
MNPYELARNSVESLRARRVPAPRVAMVLGSGLGPFADTLESLVKIPYGEIPGFFAPTVAGHAGNLCFGRAAGMDVAALQGRVHFYEGHEISAVVHPVRVLALLGAEVVIVTNSAGGIRADLRPGDFMLLTDHLNLMGVNPLRGPNDDLVGVRFLDLTEAYDPALQEAARTAAHERGIALREGVYAALAGPTYETPAEIRYLRTVGADAVGMSTVPEVIAARHAGLRVVGISCVTNAAAGLSPVKLSHAEVEETAAAAQVGFRALLSGLLAEIARLPRRPQ